jgi:hypothetical protein
MAADERPSLENVAVLLVFSSFDHAIPYNLYIENTYRIAPTCLQNICQNNPAAFCSKN